MCVSSRAAYPCIDAEILDDSSVTRCHEDLGQLQCTTSPKSPVGAVLSYHLSLVLQMRLSHFVRQIIAVLKPEAHHGGCPYYHGEVLGRHTLQSFIPTPRR